MPGATYRFSVTMLSHTRDCRAVTSGETLARHAVHMDCMHWVNRDSYLPQGSRGLKVMPHSVFLAGMLPCNVASVVPGCPSTPDVRPPTSDTLIFAWTPQPALT